MGRGWSRRFARCAELERVGRASQRFRARSAADRFDRRPSPGVEIGCSIVHHHGTQHIVTIHRHRSVQYPSSKLNAFSVRVYLLVICIYILKSRTAQVLVKYWSSTAQVPLKDHSSTAQVPLKYRSSTAQVPLTYRFSTSQDFCSSTAIIDNGKPGKVDTHCLLVR